METLLTKTRIAGIMAAGRGERLAEISKSKPLTLVAGTTLLDHVLKQCLEADIEEVVIAIRTDDNELQDYIRQYKQFAGGVRVVRVAPGGGTGVALHALVQDIGCSPCLISTADTIAPSGTYSRLLNHACRMPTQTLGVILVTSYVRDEDPIWVVTDEAGRVRTIAKGIQPSGLVFGNVRWLSATGCERIASMTVQHGERDMAIMAELLQQSDTVIRAYLEDPIFDIDDPLDVQAASCWLRTCGPQ